MGFIIGLLTAILVVTCILLVLLVLIQLPKKEAGLGLSFGGGAADALFGAGSGNVLTKATKYAATIFFVLALFLGLLQSRYFRGSPKEFEKAVNKEAAAGPATTLPPTAPAASARPVAPPTAPVPAKPITPSPASSATPAPPTPAPTTPEAPK